MIIIIILVSLFANIDLICSGNIGESCLTEGEKLPVLNDFSLYLECIGGVYVSKSCSLGELFNGEGNNCVRSSLSSFNYQIECNFTQYKPVKGNIRKYIYCENGIIKHGICKGYFDRFSKKCKMSELNNYSFNKENYYSLTQMNERLTETCIRGMKKSVEGSCTNYMECDESSAWVLHKCEDCKNFEPKSMNCVWSWKYSCETKIFSTTISPQSSSTTASPLLSSSTSTTVIPQASSTLITTASRQTSLTKILSTTSSTPTNEPNTYSTSDQSTTLPSPSPIPNTSRPGSACSRNGEKQVFNDGDNHDYLECVSHKWLKRSCSWFHYFDRKSLECKFHI